MSARISGTALECLIIALVAGALGGCQAPPKIPRGASTESGESASNTSAADSSVFRGLSSGLSIPPGSRVALIGADSSWVGALQRQLAQGGSVTRWDRSDPGSFLQPAEDSARFDDLLLVESWAALSKGSDSTPDLLLGELAERLSPGGRIWVIERRSLTESGATKPGANWADIVAMSRLAGLSVKVVDVNRLPDHVLVQAEKRTSPRR